MDKDELLWAIDDVKSELNIALVQVKELRYVLKELREQLKEAK